MIRILLSTRLGELRWTQQDLVRKTGIRPNTINLLYHELANQIRFEHLERICNALNCDISDILVQKPDEQETAEDTEEVKDDTSK